MAEKQSINAPFVVFNGGEIGGETLSRVTLENYAATSETAENLWLDANGPMGLRPGFGYETTLGTSFFRLHHFVRSVSEKFILALSEGELRVVSNGDVIARPAVSASVGDGDFGSLSFWTDISAVGSSATIGSGRLLLNSNGLAIAGVRQQVTTATPNVLHALEIHVHHGPVTFKCGSSSGGQQYIEERELRTGHHSLAFTPTGSFWVEFTSTLYRQIEVESIQIATTGDMVLDTPWLEDELQSLRFEQSLNTMYVALGTVRQRRIERWDNNSWSLVQTDELDGPFREPNTDETLTLTPSVRVGNGNLTASRSFFQPGHVGALMRITQSGQFQTRTVDAADQWSEPVRVQGVGSSRAITFTVGAGLTATVRIQRSIGNTTSWADASTSSSTSGSVSIVTTGSGAAQAYNDGLDNNDVYYRVGIKTGEYTSGSATVTIYYPFASTEGIVRITNYSSDTVVSMEVLDNLAEAAASSNWEEGAWSDYRGWPRAMTVFDGRLWSLKDDKFWGSYSEAYESHDYDEGDSSAIARSVAVGAANTGQWILGLSRLIVGTEGAEVVVRSNAFDEPLSTTNMTVREMSTFGVGNVQPIKVDTRCLYCDSSEHHLMEIVYNVQIQDYVARPLTTLHRDIGDPGLTQLAVMRRPDTRVLGVRDDGQLLVKLFDPSENVMGWARWSTPEGEIESAVVLPGGRQNQDELYVSVKRTVGGTDYRYLEKLGPVKYTTAQTARVLDSFVVYDGSSTTTITGLAHLNGKTVVVWANGYKMDGTFTVSGGQITLPQSVTQAVVGLEVVGLYKSARLAFGAQRGTALAQRGRPNTISFILRKAMKGEIRYGQNFTKMNRLKDRSTSDNLDSGPALATEITDPLTVPGRIGLDSRICIKLTGPGWIDGYVLGQELIEETP